MKKLINFVFLHKHEVLLLILIAIYVAYFTTASFLRHDNFLTGRFDLGNMDQTVWNSANGRLFQTNDDYGNISSRLASHADIILLFFSPLYLILPNPKVLLFFQTIILGAGGWFVYLLANLIIKNKTIALAFSFAFLINPHVGYTNLYDFHPVTLATTLLLASFYFLLKKRYLPFFLFALLSSFTKEHVWIVFAFFGIYMNFVQKKKAGLAIFLACIAIFYLLIWQVIPNTRGGEHFALSYYSDFGNSPSEIIKNTLTSPEKVLSILAQDDKKQYLWQLFSPLGFTSFLSPFYLIFALPDLSINMLSSNANLYQIYYHYTALITPFVFIASIYGVSFVKKQFTRFSPTFFVIYAVFSSTIAAYHLGPLPKTLHPNTDMFTKPQKDRELIVNALSSIRKTASVAATNNLGAHLSQRGVLYTIPIGTQKAEYIVFLFGDAFAKPSPLAQKQMVEDLKKNIEYEIVKEINDFILFKKKNVL